MPRRACVRALGGGGSGVAVNKSSGARTYMKMGTAGVGFGIGAKSYQVIMFFENEKVFQNFVEKGWQADTQAGAAAGTKGAAAKHALFNLNVKPSVRGAGSTGHRPGYKHSPPGSTGHATQGGYSG